MLGLEKRVDTMRQMYGEAPSEELLEKSGATKSSATIGVMLALVAIVAALAVYFVLDVRYSAKVAASDARLAAMEGKVSEALAAPQEMARRVIVLNTLGEISAKVEQLRGNMDPAHQEQLDRMDAMAKALQQELK